MSTLYDEYVASIEELKGLKRSAWTVQGYRGDKFPGRWECALGTGRSVGPFSTPVDAMLFAVEGNTNEVSRAAVAETARAQKLSALHQPEW